MDGAIEAGKEVGANAEEIAKVAVGGAMEAAGSIGTTALRAVKEKLIGVAEGVREVAGTAFPAKASGGTRPAARTKAPAPGPEPDKMGDRRRKTRE